MLQSNVPSTVGKKGMEEGKRAVGQIVRVALLALGIQLVFMLVSLPTRTDVLFDLSGGLTFVAAFLTTYWWPGLGAPAGVGAVDVDAQRRDPMRMIATGLACAWAVRLSAFLFWRVLKLGGDARFKRYKTGPWTSFAGLWVAQAAWVTLAGLPVYLLNASPATPETRTPARRALFAVGAALFSVALVTETVADLQKAAAKARRPGDFVSSGLFRYVRYPQYSSEIAVWVSALIMCSAGFSRTWQVLAASASPAATYVLLRYVSGVPLAEAAAKARYGARKDYVDYVNRTPKFVPRKAKITKSR
jgi:steroid 5-alpha reductase family enzyme